jgi:hypothetical protein
MVANTDPRQRSDIFTDCKTLFNRHPCRIILSGVALLMTILLWYANRMETLTHNMQTSLGQLQSDVAFIRGAMSSPAAPTAVALQPVHEP